MTKAFSVLTGTPPDPAYVADPAGGQARRFLRGTPHVIQAANSAFGNATLFPGGAPGNCEITITLRAALDITTDAGTNRAVVSMRQARYVVATWEYEATNQFRVLFRMRSNDKLELRVDNDKGGQTFGGRSIIVPTTDTATICNGTWREYRLWVPLKTGEGNLVHTLHVDGTQPPNENSHWLNEAPNFTAASGGPYIGALLLGAEAGNTDPATANVSALRMELKMG